VEATTMRAVIFPGQGSQFKGMGAELFAQFPEQVTIADRVLGYSIAELCTEDPRRELGQTAQTQPAVFVVNALSYLSVQAIEEQPPDYVAGHSLGEYNALLAAGAFDFETGLRLVQKRATLMAGATGGGMAAVIGIDAHDLAQLLAQAGYPRVEIANLNTRLQNILSGPREDLAAIEPHVQARGLNFVPLPVSGAFHSVAMKEAQAEFNEYLRAFEFDWLRIPVISNVEALPYSQAKIKSLLSLQITSPVRWFDTIAYLRRNGASVIDEVGPGSVLTKMLAKIDAEMRDAGAVRTV
jgi:malonyl CoA-acyl carrier protein transacylase